VSGQSETGRRAKRLSSTARRALLTAHRYPWTTAKLVLILTVVLMGAFVLGPSVAQ
jgi:hypothetical protein